MADRVRVFIENESGSNIKSVHDEKALRLLRTVEVARPYPFPYGFVLDTTNDDGDNLDCYVLTERALRRGDIVECEPIGLMEQLENDEQDHNILATLPGESMLVCDEVRTRLTDFVLHVFDNIPGRAVRAGRFLGDSEAWALIERCRALASHLRT